MLAGQYTQGGELRIVDLPLPSIHDDELLLRVEASAICGSDVKIIHQGHRKLRHGQTLILGHEFIGTIAQVGARLDNFQVGARVGVAPNIGCGACEMCRSGRANMCPDYAAFGITFDGGHAEFVRIPALAVTQGNVIAIPEHLSAIAASLIEPLSCAVSSVRISQVRSGDLVLVYGAGPMGLLNALVARAAGAARVIVVDLSDKRLEKARQLGATDIVNPGRTPVPQWVQEQTRGRGLDAVIVAVPVPALQQEGLSLLAPFGRLCLFAGLPGTQARVELDTNAIHYRNLIVTGMTGGAVHDYRAALDLIERGAVDVSQLVTHVFTFQELQQAYDMAVSGEGLKIVIARRETARG